MVIDKYIRARWRVQACNRLARRREFSRWTGLLWFTYAEACIGFSSVGWYENFFSRDCRCNLLLVTPCNELCNKIINNNSTAVYTWSKKRAREGIYPPYPSHHKIINTSLRNSRLILLVFSFSLIIPIKIHLKLDCFNNFLFYLMHLQIFPFLFYITKFMKS